MRLIVVIVSTFAWEDRDRRDNGILKVENLQEFGHKKIVHWSPGHPVGMTFL